MKTIEEVKQRALDMWYNHGYVQGDSSEIRNFWINGFCIGYFEGKLDELKEGHLKNMRPTIGENSENI